MLNNSLITISELVYVCVRVHVCKNACGRICVVLPIYRPPMIHGIDFQRKLWFFFLLLNSYLAVNLIKVNQVSKMVFETIAVA